MYSAVKVVLNGEVCKQILWLRFLGKLAAHVKDVRGENGKVALVLN
jgi:hypothetical protein